MLPRYTNIICLSKFVCYKILHSTGEINKLARGNKRHSPFPNIYIAAIYNRPSKPSPPKASLQSTLRSLHQQKTSKKGSSLYAQKRTNILAMQVKRVSIMFFSQNGELSIFHHITIHPQSKHYQPLPCQFQLYGLSEYSTTVTEDKQSKLVLFEKMEIMGINLQRTAIPDPW